MDMMTTPYICTVASYFVFSLSYSTSFTTGHDATVLFMKKPRIQTEQNKLEILRHCYRMMALSTWEAISVADLEAGMSKTRGAIFYFNKNKSELFINMIDELFLPIFRLDESDKKRYSQCGIELFFSIYKIPFERVADDLRINYKVDNPCQTMFNIIAQAQKLYPGFSEIIKTEVEREITFLNGILNPRSRKFFDVVQLYNQTVGHMFLESI